MKSLPIPAARRVALRCIEAVESGGALQETLDHGLTRGRLQPADAALATELVYGFHRCLGRIETILSDRLPRPDTLPPRLRTILRLATYEIVFLERIPAYASVDWAVECAKALFNARLAGLANAVLRGIADRPGQYADPAFYEAGAADPVQAQARWHSLPDWIVRLWTDAYDPDTVRRYLASSLTRPLTGVRFNRRRPEALARMADLAPLAAHRLESGLAFDSTRDLDLARLQGAGLLSFQSLASQQALHAVLPAIGEPVLDACAGVGGKTCLLLENGLSRVLASDLNRRRLVTLRGELRRLALPAIPLLQADASRPLPLKERPDTILLDAPCSGLGTLSRRPDLKWRRTPADVERIARLQAAMLDAAAQSLRPGGRIVYLTCTLSPRENMGQVEAALRRRPELRLETLFETPADSPLAEFFFAAVLRSR